MRGRVGVGGGVEEQDWELRSAAGGEVEGVFAGEKDDAVGNGDVGGGVAEQLVEVGQVGAGGGDAGELREGGVLDGPVGELRVGEAFFAGGVEGAADEQGYGDDGGDGQRRDFDAGALDAASGRL